MIEGAWLGLKMYICLCGASEDTWPLTNKEETATCVVPTVNEHANNILNTTKSVLILDILVYIILT